jgi:mono/diheme cytochrome c family protein
MRRIFVIALACVGVVAAETTINPEHVGARRKRFQVRCAACHGADGDRFGDLAIRNGAI